MCVKADTLIHITISLPQRQPITHLKETIPPFSLSSVAHTQESFHKLDPCRNVWKVLVTLSDFDR